MSETVRDPLLPRPLTWSVPPDHVFDLAGLADRPPADYSQEPIVVLTQRRRARLAVCRRVADLSPAELAALLWQATLVTKLVLQHEPPEPPAPTEADFEARATEQFNSMVAQVNAPIPAGVFDVREIAMMVEKFIDCQFEGQEVEAEDPQPPRLLGLSAHDIAEVLRMAPDFPTGRALHGEIARLASLTR